MSPTLPATLEHLRRQGGRHVTRRNFLATFTVASTGVALYSTGIARHEIEVVDQTICIRNLPEAFHGYRVVQISDIHMDEFTEPAFLERIVAAVNQISPPAVVITGDYISRGPMPISVSRRAMGPCAQILSRLTAPHRLCILGNHDAAVDEPFVVETLRTAGLTVLENSYLPLELDGSRLWVGGVRDPGVSTPDLSTAIPSAPDGPVILLAHEPDYADKVRQHSRFPLVDLMLSGHSHGGQIRMPFLGPVILPPMGRKYPEGLRRFDQMQLYTNRGIGTAGVPFRLNCPPEITVHHLQPA